MITRIFLILAVLAVYHVSPAWADAEQTGSYQSWSAYVSHNRGQLLCYISARPASVDGKNSKGVFAEVTHRPDEHHNGVIDILGGYNFKAGAPATLAFGKTVFTLFTHGAAAFAQDADDEKIVAAMRRSDSMVFTGTDKQGNISKASFSLKGIEPAYESISKSCKVEIAPAPAKAKKK